MQNWNVELMDQRKPKKPPTPEQQSRERERAITRGEQKQKMLIAAAHFFREKGFDRTTLDEIAERVGLTKPRLYPHFKKGKQEIIKSCVDSALREWRAAIDQVQNGNPAEAPLNLIVERYASIAFGDFGFCAIFIGTNSLAPDDRDAYLRQQADVDARFKSLLASAIPSEIQPHVDPEFLWLIATSLIHGIALLKNPPVGRQQTLSKALTAVLAGSHVKV